MSEGVGIGVEVVDFALDLTGRRRDRCSAREEEDDDGSCVIPGVVLVAGKAGEAAGAEGIVFAMA